MPSRAGAMCVDRRVRIGLDRDRSSPSAASAAAEFPRARTHRGWSLRAATRLRAISERAARSYGVAATPSSPRTGDTSPDQITTAIVAEMAGARLPWGPAGACHRRESSVNMSFILPWGVEPVASLRSGRRRRLSTSACFDATLRVLVEPARRSLGSPATRVLMDPALTATALPSVPSAVLHALVLQNRLGLHGRLSRSFDALLAITSEPYGRIADMFRPTSARSVKKSRGNG